MNSTRCGQAGQTSSSTGMGTTTAQQTPATSVLKPNQRTQSRQPNRPRHPRLPESLSRNPNIWF